MWYNTKAIEFDGFCIALVVQWIECNFAEVVIQVRFLAGAQNRDSKKIPLVALLLCYHLHMRYLGIDYGTKRVGVAVSDEMGSLAFPRAIFSNNAELIPNILKLFEEEEIGGIVLGESHTQSGQENKVMKEITVFKEKLEQETGRQVFLESEFMTSMEASRQRFEMQSEQGRNTRSDKTKIDDSAAALILQRFLDKKNFSKN